jgi:hypothetical protein
MIELARRWAPYGAVLAACRRCGLRRAALVAPLVRNGIDPEAVRRAPRPGSMVPRGWTTSSETEGGCPWCGDRTAGPAERAMTC